MSMHIIKWDQGVAHWTFNGLAHFAAMLADPLLRAGTVNTLLFALFAVAAEMGLGLFLALLVSRIGRGRVAYRTIFLLPVLIPGIVIGAIWKLMYNPDFGVINQLFGMLHLDGHDWLGDGKLALASVMVVDIWHWTPFVFLLLLAAIESLPQDVHEAATIDGAGAWRTAWSVKLPALRPALMLTLVFSVIGSFQLFNEPNILRTLAPNIITTYFTPNMYAYNLSFAGQQYNASATVAIVMGVITAVIAYVVQLRGARKEN
jgi:multiple sugar transport system permease protein